MRYAIGVFAFAIICGCVAAQMTMLGGATKQAPIPEDQVQVFMSEKDVPGEYVKIAIVHTQGESIWTNEQGMIKKAQKETAKIGANGIIIESINEPSSGAKVAAAIFGVGTTRRGQIVAIRYKPKESNPDTTKTKP